MYFVMATCRQIGLFVVSSTSDSVTLFSFNETVYDFKPLVLLLLVTDTDSISTLLNIDYKSIIISLHPAY